MSMYAALWRALPGGRLAKSLECLLLFGVVVAALFVWVFPAVAPVLPIDRVTVDGPVPTAAPVPSAPPAGAAGSTPSATAPRSATSSSHPTTSSRSTTSTRSTRATSTHPATSTARTAPPPASSPNGS